MTNDSPAVELLAPAGCQASLQAAIDNGADAVYFGLAQLNMRARSRRSFHLGDLPDIMERCRAGGVKGYLTLNTLLYDHDLKLTDSLLQAALDNGVNAIIAADMACVLRARELGLRCIYRRSYRYPITRHWPSTHSFVTASFWRVS